jgi:CDP-diacylglycerol--glycerol-3-phosphate 3-phosphatidyltransferase
VAGSRLPSERSGAIGAGAPALRGGRWRTWANALTFLRLLAALPLALAIASGASAAALSLFALAVVTDLADGRVARRRGEASSLGSLLDHATDASFVSIGLGALVCAGSVPAPLPLLVAAAFVQYALDSRSLAGRPLRASALGRLNGIAYFVLLGVPVVRDGLSVGWPPDATVLALGWALVVTTLVSMAARLRALRAASG